MQTYWLENVRGASTDYTRSTGGSEGTPSTHFETTPSPVEQAPAAPTKDIGQGEGQYQASAQVEC